jgi:3',5'-cyclic AMP phosphodiesterase CpdA
VQYAVEFEGLRLVVCDTVEEGEDGGAYDEDRARWLAATLDAAPDIPTVVALHHPPIPSGIQWMDSPPDAPWIGRIEAVLSTRPQVIQTICGHVHRPYHGLFAGRPVSVSSATSLQLTLDQSAIDVMRPDGREILIGEPPGFSLLCWDRQRLTVHHVLAGAFPDLIRFEAPFLRD